MSFDPILVDATLHSIACGQAPLYDIVTEQNELMQKMACVDECSEAAAFLRWQLLLIELAQSFVRNKVDEVRHKAQMESTSLYTALGYRNSESQSTVQHRGCGWADATSFTGFRRDAQSTYRAVSDKDGIIFGQNWSTGSDRGTRDGYGNANGHSDHNIDEQGVVTRSSLVFTIGTHDRFQGTSPDGGEETSLQNAIISNNPLTTTVFDVDIPIALEDRFNSGNWAISGADGSFSCNACNYNFTGFQYNFGQCYPSINKRSISRHGTDSFRGNGTISVSLGFAGIFGVSADMRWGSEQRFSSGFSQRYVENRHTDHEADIRSSASQTDRWMVNNLDGATSSHDQMTTQHNAHATSQGYRDATSHVKEATNSIDTADGETHSGADRAAHTERSLQGQSTAAGNAHSQSRTDADSASSTKAEATYWHQLSVALRDMWKQVFEQLVETRKLLAATSPVHGNLVTRYNRKSSCYASSTLLPHKGKGTFNQRLTRYF